MSVVVSERKESKYQFYKNAISLRESIIFLLLRDFGVKARMRTIDFYKTKMEESDAKLFESLMAKYEIQKVPEEYPNWLIEKFRDTVYRLLEDMHKDITFAYSIWPTNKAEFEEKRIWQDRAIACCESLLQEFTLIIDILPVDANKYVNYVKKIDDEIKLLKGWRKSSNKLNKWGND